MAICRILISDTAFDPADSKSSLERGSTELYAKEYAGLFPQRRTFCNSQ